MRNNQQSAGLNRSRIFNRLFFVTSRQLWLHRSGVAFDCADWFVDFAKPAYSSQFNTSGNCSSTEIKQD